MSGRRREQVRRQADTRDLELLGKPGADARGVELAADAAVGIVLVEDGLHRGLPAELVQRLERAARPLVATFPGPHLAAPEAAEEAVLEILRRAIGYRVRLP